MSFQFIFTTTDANRFTHKYIILPWIFYFVCDTVNPTQTSLHELALLGRAEQIDLPNPCMLVCHPELCYNKPWQSLTPWWCWEMGLRCGRWHCSPGQWLAGCCLGFVSLWGTVSWIKCNNTVTSYPLKSREITAIQYLQCIYFKRRLYTSNLL